MNSKYLVDRNRGFTRLPYIGRCRVSSKQSAVDVTHCQGEGVSPTYANFHLIPFRAKVEQSFGILASRWGILWRTLRVRRSKLIHALCHLHNFCVDDGSLEIGTSDETAESGKFGSKNSQGILSPGLQGPTGKLPSKEATRKCARSSRLRQLGRNGPGVTSSVTLFGRCLKLLVVSEDLLNLTTSSPLVSSFIDHAALPTSLHIHISRQPLLVIQHYPPAYIVTGLCGLVNTTY